MKKLIDSIKKNLELTVLDMTKGNRMIRAGIGQNDGRWFVRIDLWFKGFRVTKREAEVVK